MKDLFDPEPQVQDGRSIDPALGLLSGEAGHVEVKKPDVAWPLPTEGVSSIVPAQATWVDPSGPTYYGLPLVKEPVWAPPVPLYFWLGGAAGAASLLSLTTRLFGGRGLARLTRHARWLAALGDNLGAACLIYDLGRPSRFLNMLRVFRKTSPMSVGSWILAASGACNTGAALFGERRGLGGSAARAAGAVGGLLGMPLAGYTAVLLSNSAVPLWQAGRRSLPLLFMCSGVATAGSLLALTAGSEREQRAVARFALAGQLGELAATVALHREVGRVPRVARPLRHGGSGLLLDAAAALTAASLVTALVPGRSRGKRWTAGILGALGSLALRFGVTAAGNASARDPRASFAQQRAGHGTAEVTRRAAVAPSPAPTAH